MDAMKTPDGQSAGEREEALFAGALNHPAAQDRAAYLLRACPDDEALRRKVESLARAHFAAENFMKHPAPEDDGHGPGGTVIVPATERPGDWIGPYKLREQVGEGGCGVVYVADQDEPIRRRVALKVIKLGMDTKAVIARFEAERQALAMMEHPNIAKVLDAGTTRAGRPYFVMELVRGMAITRYCDQEKLDTEARLELFIKVCQAIQHAHQKGIIHRDIKPSNVLVTLHDGVPVPKVIDFGIAKPTRQNLTDQTVYTQLHQFLGTPAYMSPEQAEMSGLDIDTRADIYSLGVLLYELLTGSTPFDASELLSSGLDEMRRIIREREPVRPSTKLSQTLEVVPPDLAKESAQVAAQKLQRARDRVCEIRGDLDWVVMKCLEKDRGRRYETASALAQEVMRHLHDEPVQARPPSALYRFQKAWRRHRLAFNAGLAVAAALVAGLALSLWLLSAANEARREADQARIAEQEQKLEAQAGTLRANQSERHAQTAQQMAEELRRVAEEEELATRRRTYAADMLLGQQALQAGNLRRARQLLERNRPDAGEEDLRGWEWRHLWVRCRAQSRFQVDISGRPTKAVFTADGNRLICLLTGPTVGGKVSYWDPAAGREETVLQEAGANESLLFSSSMLTLSLDRQWITAPAHSEADGSSVRVWDVEKRALVAGFHLGTAMPYSLALSRTNRTLAVSMWDGTAYLWRFSPSTTTKHLTLLEDPEEHAGTLCYSPDGRQLALGVNRRNSAHGGDVEIRLLDAETGRLNATIPTMLRGRVSALAFSPDGRHLAVGCVFLDSRIAVWDAREKTLTTLRGHQGFVDALAFSPDGERLASASGDQTIKLWNTRTWTEESTLLGHTEEVRSVEFSPDGRQLASVGTDGQLHVWDLGGSRQQHHDLRLPREWTSVDVSPDGKAMVSVSQQGTVQLWDAVTLEERPAFPELGTNQVAAFWIAPDEILLGCSSPPRIKAWNPVQGIVEVFPLKPVEGSLEFAFLPACQVLVAALAEVGSTNVVVQRWDAATRRELSTEVFDAGGVSHFADGLRSFAEHLSPDGKWLALWQFFGSQIEIHNLVSGRTEKHVDTPQKMVEGLALFAGAETLAFASSHKIEAYVQELATGRTIATLRGHNLPLKTVVLSPDQHRMATATIGQEPVKLWDTTSWQEVASLEPGPDQYLGNPRFLADGNTIAMRETGLDGSEWIRLWRAPSWEQINTVEAAAAGAAEE
jgi:eukaryotic-like serine/threonine-protein kinase